MNKLNECKPNDIFIIKYIKGTEEQKRHLQNLGFIPSSIKYRPALTMTSELSFAFSIMVFKVFSIRYPPYFFVDKIISYMGGFVNKDKVKNKAVASQQPQIDDKVIKMSRR